MMRTRVADAERLVSDLPSSDAPRTFSSSDVRVTSTEPRIAGVLRSGAASSTPGCTGGTSRATAGIA